MPVNRATLGLSNFPRYQEITKWRLSDAVLCVVFSLVNNAIANAEPFQRQFFLADLTISHPHAETQRVGSTALLMYSLVLPAVVICCFTLLVADAKHKPYLLYISLLGLALSWSTTSLVTDYLKNWIGRLRPDFLARCRPRDGIPGHVLVTAAEVCTTSNLPKLMDGFRTTPSGHSSESFAGLGYLYLWLCGQLLTDLPQVGSWRKCLASVPLLIATTVALSRTEDYRHHFVDVIIGSCLGMAIAFWAYHRNFPSISSPIPFKPVLDDTDVTLELGKSEFKPLNDEEENSTAN
ncbi:LAMI_0D03906g1_1 [Lachancea mirantina]|uniref:LAMI_0D03906g1_1 n=1 Tax=Lachancea mirantina TaxID=1230905 RepID=A0A1G4JA91_9SACH|nr:LAMI_0D03906g1_1 [Lachancea mirantina]